MPILKRRTNRLLTSLCLDLRVFQGFRDFRYLRYLRYLRYFLDLLDFRYFRDLRDLRYIHGLRTLQNLQDWWYLRDLRDLRDFRYLRDKILTKEIAEKALQTLSQVTGVNIDLEEQVDFLFILLGRVLHIEETEEVGDTIETEIHEIVQGVYPAFTLASDETIRATALDILRYLPLRTANEITYALNLANKTTDQQVQAALAKALEYAILKTPTAKDALELGRKSPVEVVREAVEERLED